MSQHRDKTATETVTSQVCLFSTNIPRPPTAPAAPCSYLSHPPSHSGHTGQMGCRRRRGRLNLQTSHNYTSSNFNTNSPVRYLRLYCFGCNVGLTLWDVADYVKKRFFFSKERKKKDHRTIKMLGKKVLVAGLPVLQAKLNVGEKVLFAFEDTINDPRCSFQFPISD